MRDGKDSGFKVLFLMIGDLDRASCRYRVYQYLPYFKHIIPEIVWSARESGDLAERARGADLVFIQKALFSPEFLTALQEKGTRLVYDFDDTVYLDEDFTTRINTQSLNFRRFRSMMGHCGLVLAGNQYLCEFAKEFHRKVLVVPSTVDVLQYPAKKPLEKKHAVIGWIGHSSNLQYLSLLREPLNQLKRHCAGWSFRVISDRPWPAQGLPVEFRKWNLQYLRELEQLDIGVMPLFAGDIWAKGKCGFKALQYMAAGIPALLSPVGVNRYLVTEGKTGFLAENAQEWFAKLRRLLLSGDLRRRVGRGGRERVAANFAANTWAKCLEQLLIEEIRGNAAR